MQAVTVITVRSTAPTHQEDSMYIHRISKDVATDVRTLLATIPGSYSLPIYSPALPECGMPEREWIAVYAPMAPGHDILTISVEGE